MNGCTSALPRTVITALATVWLALITGPATIGYAASNETRKGQDSPSRQTTTAPTTAPWLTQEERAWLRNHPVIRVAQDPAWPPIEFADPKGEPSGMAEDYLRLIEQRLGITFQRIRGLSWQESYARLQRWDIDMTTSAAETPERARFWAFTAPYLNIRIVVLTRTDVTFLASLRDLAGKKTAVVDGYVAGYWLSRDFPDIPLVRVKTVREGLGLLQKGEVFALVDNMLISSYYLAKLELYNLKIAGETPYVNAQCMAVRKDWAPLAGILQKALDSLSETERAQIYNRWMPIRYEHGFNYALLWKMLAGFAVIVAGLLVWNRRLHREVGRRIEAQAALKTSEERFRRLFHAATFPLCFADKDGVLLDANNRFVQAFGYAPEDVPTIGEWWRLAYPDPDYRRWATTTWEAAVRRATERKTDIEPIEYRITCKNGDVRTVVISGTIIDDNFLASFFDITERKQAEESLLKAREEIEKSCLAQSELVERLNEAQEVAKIGSWDWDLKTNAVWWSDETYQLFGVSKSDYVPSFESNARLIHPDDLDSYRNSFARSLKTGEPLDIEVRILTTDGVTRCCRARGKCSYDASGQPVRFIGTVMDITAYKRAEGELKTSEENYRTLFDSAGDAIFILDDQGRILAVNSMACENYGYTQSELLSMTVSSIDTPEHSVHAPERIARLMELGMVQFESEHRRKDETKIMVEVNARRISWNGQPAMISICRDITDRKRAEETQERLQAQLNQAQKMESVGRLAGGVAHDFNNMLGAILGNVELALEQIDPTQALALHLHEIQKAAERSADLTRQLLAFARKQTVTPKTLDLNETVEGMLKMLRRLIGEDITLRWLPGTNLVPVKVDPSQIDQILANLCVNARDAIAGVGRITIETEVAAFDEDSVATHSGILPGEYVMLAVSDDGCGMGRETLDHLFEPFYTTKEVGKGTGLGLATVYGIVKQNRGFINVYSEPDRGTTFKIYLPKHVGKAEQLQTLGPMEPIAHGHETILLVEDEPAILKNTATILERSGYTVLTAATPGEAIRLAEEHPGEIHLLMTDVIMPEMNGRDLAKRLISLYPNLKRLFMSGYTADVIAHHGVLDPGVNFVQKPFAIRDVTAKVREVLDS